MLIKPLPTEKLAGYIASAGLLVLPTWMWVGYLFVVSRACDRTCQHIIRDGKKGPEEARKKIKQPKSKKREAATKQ